MTTTSTPIPWLAHRRDGTLVVRQARGARSWPVGRVDASRETVTAVLTAAWRALPHPARGTDEALTHAHARVTWVREALAAAGIPVVLPTDPAEATDLLSPAAVAERRGCGITAVKTAISRGDLRATLVRGPGGDPSIYGVRPEDADAWMPRTVGRPRG